MKAENFYTVCTDFASDFVIHSDGSISQSGDGKLVRPMVVPSGKYSTIERQFPIIKNVKQDFESFKFLWNKYSNVFCMTYGEILTDLQPLLFHIDCLDVQLENSRYSIMYYRSLRAGLFTEYSKYVNIDDFRTINEMLHEINEKYFLLSSEDFKFELVFKAGEFCGTRKILAKLSTAIC